MASRKMEVYTGVTDVNKFITKCELHCTLKGYTEEEKAVFIAERLEDAAFDVYTTLTTDDRKDPEKIKTALLNNFHRSKRNREVAVEELANRQRLPNENAEVFAYKIKDLVKLAYPKFNDEATSVLAKDYFVKRLHPDIQRELRKAKDYDDKTLDDLASDTTLLEIAGINSQSDKKDVIGSVQEANKLESKVDRLLEILQNSEITEDEEKVNFAGATDSSYNRNFYRKRGRGTGNSYRRSFKTPLECRNCSSTDHLYRQCPSRYCQACGNKDHDGWDKVCPKYK